MGAPENERLVITKDIILIQDPNPEEDDGNNYNLKVQRPVQDTVTIQDESQQLTVGEVDYSITWIYNKGHFLEQLKNTMMNEKKALIEEIKNMNEGQMQEHLQQEL